MTEMMNINEQELAAVAGGESGNLPESVLSKMNSYERYQYQELYRLLNIAIEERDYASMRFYYNEAVSWEMQMKRKYY